MSTYRLLFLGAGFSCLAGVPLGPNLFREVRKKIAAEYSSDNPVERDIERFIKYLSDCFHRTVLADDIDCEEFLGFLDVEHYLGLKGKDTWSSEGNESQLMIRSAIAQVIYICTPQSAQDIPEAYRRFARNLTTSDYILTFNYDTLLENALELEGIQYRLFPDRYSEVHPMSCISDTSKDELVLIKLHGSVDWFSRAHFDEHVALVRSAPHMYPPAYQPSNPIFGHDAIVTPTPIVDGPRPDNDLLQMLYRVRDLAQALSQPFWKCTPFILVPSSTKLFYAQPLLEFWRGLQRFGGLNLSLGIIGYSLPRYDDYAMQAIYHIANNYQNFEPDLTHNGRQKTKVRIIDFQPTADGARKFRERYNFLDWNRTETWFDGFSDKAADWILR
jgi:SIR2-like domain